MDVEELRVEIVSIENILSGVTGLPIVSSRFFPSDVTEFPKDEMPESFLPFSYFLKLGDGNESYQINFSADFEDKYSKNDWLPNVSWRLEYNGQTLIDAGYSVIGGCNMKAHEVAARIGKERYNCLKNALGGPDPEVAFMDYETYALEEISGGDSESYFKSIYLALMIHLKERGKVVPPILGKDPELRGKMDAGLVEEVDRILKGKRFLLSTEFDAGMMTHVDAEIAAIKAKTLREYKLRDPMILIEQKFEYIDVELIEKGIEDSFLPYNILVVENDLQLYEVFTRMVKKAFERDGRYKGTKLITEVNLPACMELCKTGQIDLVLFNWNNPSYGEALMFGYGRDEDGTTSLVMDEDGFTCGDGSPFNAEYLKEACERIDIRSEWMEMMAAECEKEGVDVPPHFVVRSQEECQYIGVIVNELLENRIIGNNMPQEATEEDFSF